MVFAADARCSEFQSWSAVGLRERQLCYQIEHHLFPDLPSNRYPQIAVRVRGLCDKYNPPYTSGACAPVSVDPTDRPQVALPDGFLIASKDDAPETARNGSSVPTPRQLPIGWPDNRAAHGIAGARTPTPTLTNRLGVALIGAPILAGSVQTPACPGSTAAPFAGAPLVVTVTEVPMVRPGPEGV